MNPFPLQLSERGYVAAATAGIIDNNCSAIIFGGVGRSKGSDKEAHSFKLYISRSIAGVFTAKAILDSYYIIRTF